MTARNYLVLALSMAWLALSPGLVSAQPSEAQINAVKQNCRSDFISNCRSVKPGGPEAIQCLKEKATSPGCKAALSALGGAPAQAAPSAPAQHAPPPAAAAPTPAAPPPAAARTHPLRAPPPPRNRQRQNLPPRRSPRRPKPLVEARGAKARRGRNAAGGPHRQRR